MGGQCSVGHLKQQFQILKQYSHPSLGQIKVIRSNKANFNNSNNHSYIGTAGHIYQPKDGQLIGLKQVTFSNTKQLQMYLRCVKQANSYYKIPTLLRILSYEVNTKNGNIHSSYTNRNFSHNHNLSCGSSSSISIFFNYYQHSLDQMLKQKRRQLLNFNTNSNNNKKQKHKLPNNIKLNDYEKIDRLPHQERKIINIYFQEVQVLRMIDHIVGALYFLNHLEHKHEAVCAQNILIDEQGKFILVDAIVFQLKTNYEKTLNQHVNHNQKGFKPKSITFNHANLNYLSPQLLAHIKNKNVDHHQSTQKAEVFSVGLIALDMCLLDYKILQCSAYNQQQLGFPSLFDKHNLKLNKNQLNKALIQARQRYSAQLVDLLANMLQFDPHKRINFSSLIDILSPLLAQNLSQIQNLFNSSNIMQNHDLSINGYSQPRNQVNTYNPTMSTNLLMNKLSQLQSNYQKIMNSRIVFQQGTVLATDLNNQGQSSPRWNRNQLDQKFIIQDEKRILKQLRKINIVSKNIASNAHKNSKIKGDHKNNKQRRQFRGSQLYDLYLSEYQTIKQNRMR